MAGKQKQTAAAQTKAKVNNMQGTGVPRWAPWAILLVTAIIYSRAVGNGFTYIDDDYYILTNYYLRDFSLNGIKAIFTHFYSFNYHPLTTLTNLVEYTLWGLNPLPYHLFNVALHLLNVWLVYKVAEKLSGKGITAVVVSILFAVHPMHVESVAWVAERKDVLYSAFYLAALLQYLQYSESGYRSKYLIYALLFFVCSLLSKSAAVTLPLVLVAIDVYKGRTLNGKAIGEKIPFLLLSVLFGILAIMSQKAGGAVSDMSLQYSLPIRVVLLLSGLSAYFIQLVLPFGLSAIHYYPDLHGGGLPWYYYLSVPFLAALAWLVTRRSAFRKEILFGTAFFLLSISVMLQLITVGGAMYAERYTYISYIGLFYIAGQFIADKWETPSANTIASVFGVFALLCAILSWDRIGYWRDTDTLFADITEHNKDNSRTAMVYMYWAKGKVNDGNQKEAIELYTKAIALQPKADQVLYNRGLAYDMLHDYKAAIADYDKAIALLPTSQAYNARGWAWSETGDKTKAVADYNSAIAADPRSPDPYNNRGWARYMSGDTAAAIADYNKAIELLPTFTKPYYNRAAVSIARHDTRSAIADYDKLIAINPNDQQAYFNRGVAKYMAKDAGACNDWRKATELGNADAAGMIQQYCK